MGLQYKVDVQDNGSAKLKKFNKELKVTSEVSDEWHKNIKRSIGNVLGFYAVLSGIKSITKLTDDYADAVTALSKKLGKDAPAGVIAYQKHSQEFEKSLATLKVTMAEEFLPTLDLMIQGAAKLAGWMGKLASLPSAIGKGLANIFHPLNDDAKKAMANGTMSAGGNGLSRDQIIAAMMNKDKEGRPKKVESYADRMSRNSNEMLKEWQDKQKATKDYYDELQKLRDESADAEFNRIHEEREARIELREMDKADEAARLLAIKTKQELEFESFQNGLSNAVALSDMFKDNGREAFALSKALAVAQASMNAGIAFNAALSAVPFGPWNFVQAATALALGMGQVATISATQYQGKREGGIVSGRGNGTADNIMVRLSPGEGVLTERDLEKAGGFNSIKRWIDGGGSSGTTINIHGDIIGDDRFVRDRFIPALKRAGTRL